MKKTGDDDETLETRTGHGNVRTQSGGGHDNGRKITDDPSETVDDPGENNTRGGPVGISEHRQSRATVSDGTRYEAGRSGIRTRAARNGRGGRQFIETYGGTRRRALPTDTDYAIPTTVVKTPIWCDNF